MINHISECCKQNIRLDTTERGRWSTGICARNWNLNIQASGICSTESVLENETQKVLWDFEIQKDHLISARPSNNPQKRAPCE